MLSWGKVGSCLPRQVHFCSAFFFVMSLRLGVPIRETCSSRCALPSDFWFNQDGFRFYELINRMGISLASRFDSFDERLVNGRA